MADPSLIACLYPYGHGAAGTNAKSTIDMVENASHRIDPLLEDRSRQSSLAPEGHDGDDDGDYDDYVYGQESDHPSNIPNNDYTPGLQLRFDDWRKNRMGFVLGTSPSCDIVLPKKESLRSLAPRQCVITFDSHGRLIVRDLQERSKNRRGTAVMYMNKGGQKRLNFTWILGGDPFTELNKPIILALHDNLQFQIVAAQHDISSPQYQENLALFANRVATDVHDLTLGGLGFDCLSSTAAASGAQTPSTDAILLKNGELGIGAQAVVFRLWDASTGDDYASKEPLAQKFYRRLSAEVQLLSQVNHDHIVQCFPALSSTAPIPRLVLECLPLGSLASQNELKTLSIEDAFDLLSQSLSALRYLHERDNPIVHRDIKPDNILVYSRTPTLHIKLSDFGYSKESEDYLKTRCGTPLYTAPEVFKCKSYDAAVDIWSLGVVVYQYAQDLPGLDLEGRFEGSRWTKSIIRKLEADVEETYCPLLTFLSIAMLVKDRQARYSAHRCSKEIRRLDVWQFRCSLANPTPYRDPRGHETTVLYEPLHYPTARDDPESVIPPPDSVQEEWRSNRSDAPSPESQPHVSVSTYSGRARRTSTSRESKLTSPPRDKGKGKGKAPGKRRSDRSDASIDETAYFYNHVSDHLHPFYVGSSLGRAGELECGWTEEEGITEASSAAPAQEAGLGQPAGGGGVLSSSVLVDWYHDPRWAGPPPDVEDQTYGPLR